MRKNKKGFTLVELVIVIAVIAILSAVLLPTFSNVIENAKVSSATSNAKNAFKSYYATDSTCDYSDGFDSMDNYHNFIVVVINGQASADYVFVVDEDGNLEIQTKGLKSSLAKFNTSVYHDKLVGDNADEKADALHIFLNDTVTDVPQNYESDGGKSGKLSNFGYSNVVIIAPLA